MAKIIEKKIEKTTHHYACEHCGKEYESRRDAEYHEEQEHILPSFKEHKGFIWIENTERARAYADAHGAWIRNQTIQQPGWYYPDIYESFDEEPPRIRFLTPDERIDDLDREIAKLSKLWADAVETKNV